MWLYSRTAFKKIFLPVDKSFRENEKDSWASSIQERIGPISENIEDKNSKTETDGNSQSDFTRKIATTI